MVQIELYGGYGTDRALGWLWYRESFMVIMVQTELYGGYGTQRNFL
jgi:hypothetical protein